MTRRDLLRTAGAGLALALSACAGQAASPSPSPAASSAPATAAKPTAGSSASASAKPAAGGASAAASPAGGSPAAKPSGQAVKAAWVARTAGETLWPLAKEAGYFDKYGVNVDLQFIESSTTAIPAIISGELGPVSMAGAAVVGADASGADIVMIAGLQNQSIFRIMAVPSINRIEDLKGKTVAVVQLGSNDYYMWQRIMAKQGWAKNDLKFTAATSLQGQIALLQRGDAQAVAVSPPNNVLAENAGGHQILDTASLNSPEQNLGVTVKRTYLAANRGVCLAMLKATIEAVDRYRKDPTYTKGVIKTMLKTDDQRLVDAGYDAYLPIFPTEPYPTVAGFQETITEIAAQNPKAANLKPEQLMDTSLVDELKNSGFIKQVFG